MVVKGDVDIIEGSANIIADNLSQQATSWAKEFFPTIPGSAQYAENYDDNDDNSDSNNNLNDNMNDNMSNDDNLNDNLNETINQNNN